jgi:hypothetical protein
LLNAECAGVVELADAPDSKSGGGNSVWVQLPPPAPNKSVVKGKGLAQIIHSTGYVFKRRGVQSKSV